MESEWMVKKTIIISGATSMIGQAVSRYLSVTDNQLILIGRTLSKLKHLAKSLSGAAKCFFIKAINSNGLAEKVTIDKSGANNAGLNLINLQLALLFMFGGVFHQLSIINNATGLLFLYTFHPFSSCHSCWTYVFF